MKISEFFVLVIAFLLCGSANAQPSTDEIRVAYDTGAFTLNLDSLLKHRKVTLKNIKITNHLGELKYTLREAKGVSILDLLGSVKLGSQSPKAFSTYILKASSADGYFVTFSWNEIYNTSIGENTYILIEIDGKPISDEKGGEFILFSAQDKFSGRRFVKWINEIKFIKLTGNDD